MNTEDKNPLTYGVSYTYWHECLQSLLIDHNMDVPDSDFDLTKCYHDDLSPRDVLYMLRIRTIKTANLTLRVFDAYGSFGIQFTNNAQIRRFYKLNPDVKRVMDEKTNLLNTSRY